MRKQIIRKLQHALPKIEMIDEDTLLQEANDIIHQQGTITSSFITSLSSQYGTDLGTAVLYQCLMLKHNDFIHLINEVPIIRKPSQVPHRFIIIPALLHNLYPAMGGKGALFGKICESYGHRVDYLDTNGGLSVATSSKLIEKAVNQYQDESIWLISLSRGSLDVMRYLSTLKIMPRNIKGWVNIGGLIQGSPIADHMVSTYFKRLKVRLICKICDVQYPAVQDFKTTNRFLLEDVPSFKKIKLINVVGFPIRSHIPTYLQNRYLKLSKLGPNDAMMLLLNYLEFPGDLYPIWGCDHFFRLPGISRTIHRIINHIEKISKPYE